MNKKMLTLLAALFFAQAYAGNTVWAQEDDFGDVPQISDELSQQAETSPEEPPAAAETPESSSGDTMDLDSEVAGTPDAGEEMVMEPTPVQAEEGVTQTEKKVINITPEMQQVEQMQRELTTTDPGENMRARMGAGSRVPGDLIGEGAAEAPQVYIVKLGDTLWDISSRFLNDPFLWPSIHEKNPQVINPHLIYPGEPITIYPRDYELASTQVVQLLPPPELEEAPEALPPEEVKEIEEEVAPQVQFEEIVQEVEPTEEELADRDQFLAELTKKSEVEVFDEAATELISKKKALLARADRNAIEYKRADAAGWLEMMDQSELNRAGYILAQEDKQARLRAAPGDLVFINRGKINGVAQGDRYLVFRIDKEIKHPVTGDYIGNKILIVGRMQVEAVYERTSAARITESYEDIATGEAKVANLDQYDRVMPEMDFQKEIRFKANDQQIEGYVVAARENKLSLAPNDIIYLDRGSNDGVEVGNLFKIYRPNRAVHDPEVNDRVQLPSFYVGEALVIRTNEATSTALIMTSRREVVAGDQVSISKIDFDATQTELPVNSAKK